jgi:RNA polymerase sigma factor (sigma-70 family)
MSSIPLTTFPTQVATFEALLAPELDMLYRIAYRFTANAADAEDLLQDLLVKLYPKTDELATVETLRPWLIRALRNQYVDSVRKHRRSPSGWLRSVTGSDDEVLAELRSGDPTPEEAALKDDLQGRLQQALAGLNAEHRVVVTLHDVEGYRLTEIQSMLGVPVGTLKSRLHRARAQLRAALEMEPLMQRRRV